MNSLHQLRSKVDPELMEVMLGVAHQHPTVLMRVFDKKIQYRFPETWQSDDWIDLGNLQDNSWYQTYAKRLSEARRAELIEKFTQEST